MASNRIGRINEEMQKELAALLRQLKDPRVQKTMISITRVFVSFLDKDCAREGLQGLKSASGYLRRELGSRLQLRYTPELVWQEDHSITYGAHILDLLSTLDIPKDDDGDSHDPQDPA